MRTRLCLSLVLLFGCSEPQETGQRGEQRLNPDGGGGTGGAGQAVDAGADSGPTPTASSCADTACDPNATCDASGGSASCTCNPGYTGSGASCSDVDECETDNGDCDEHATCMNRPGSRRCLCDETFSGDGLSCTGTDECADAALNTCDPNASCTDAVEGFACACGDGTSGDGFGCGDVDECADVDLFPCAANASCKNTFGGYACECDPLFAGDGSTECIALCAAQPCAANQLCRVLRGGADCSAPACEPGYVGDGTTCTVIAGDDCGACDGMDGDDAPGAVCTGTAGSGTCTCAPGYTGTVPTCTDVDECAASSNGGCGSQATCIDVDGGFFCDCDAGYAWNGSACVDVDECAADTSPCHPNATCADTDGGFTCTCKAGYAGDGGTCRDVDECADAALNDCLDDGTARCVNTAGAFECRCRRGYSGDGVTECENVDECRNPSLNDCADSATCTDESPADNPVGYECTCPEGLGGDGTQCTDVNECQNAALNDCAANASCINEPGGYRCECQSPFAGDPSACHCDLSGYWAMRQDVDSCWCDRDLVGVTVVAGGTAETTVWELHRYDYDGDTIAVEKVGCGADSSPDFISPHFSETYSSYVPDETFFALEMDRGRDIEEPGIVPGSMFTTPDEAALAGIDLGANRECEDCWPASSTDINPVGGAAPAWTDTDGDGVPGLTLWPRVPSRRTRDGSDYYNYLPVNLDMTNNSVPTERAVCVSVASRIITRLEADVESCERIVGEVVNVHSEGRVGSCALVPMGEDQDDFSCNAGDWDTLQRCDAAAVQRLDEQDQSQTSTASFELVKIGGPDDDIDCHDVRAALPALVRTTPTPIACDCP